MDLGSWEGVPKSQKMFTFPKQESAIQVLKSETHNRNTSSVKPAGLSATWTRNLVQQLMKTGGECPVQTWKTTDYCKIPIFPLRDLRISMSKENGQLSKLNYDVKALSF